MATVPVALPPSNASSITAGPCLIERLRGTRVVLSNVVTSTASPIGIFAVPVTTQAPPFSSIVCVIDIGIVCPPASIFPW